MAEQKPYNVAYGDYKNGMSYADIAKKYKVSLSTVKSWYARHWKRIQEQIAKDAELQSSSNNDVVGMQNGMKPQSAKPVNKKVGDVVQVVVNKQIIETRPESLVQYDVDYESKLTDRQRRFVLEYMIDLNATQAAIRSGYEPRTASVIGSRLRDDVNVASCIARAEAERSKRTGINSDMLITTLGSYSRTKISDIIDMTTGQIRDDVTEEALLAVQSMKIEPIINIKTGVIMGYKYDIRMADKVRSADLTATIMGIKVERKEVHTTVDDMTSDERERKIQELLAKRNTIDIECV